MPELATDLVRRKVAVIFASGPPAAAAAKRATQTIPIVFVSGGDPVQMGLVSSFHRPNGNVTGFYFLATELVSGWGPEALFVGPEPLFNTERTQLVDLAARHALPASYFQRD